MADITQKFIVDAGDSLTTLNALAQGFGAVNQSIAGSNKTLNGVATGSKKASTALGATGAAAKKLGEDGNAGFSRFTVSFQTMVRIVTTQLIVRALADIRAAMNESVSSAIEFEKQVSLISTISAEKNIDRLKTQVLDLSNAFNAPLGDVGAGLYETISNQIADGAEATKFLAETLQFAAITGSSAADSLRLVSGTTNAFGLDIKNNELLLAKFFETIDLGAVTATELANSIGSVQTIAAQTGVSVDELLAAFADISIAGLSGAEAATQIRGTLNALIKPTDQMTAALRQLGFSSGEQAVQALGLQGALKAVIGTTDGSVAAISELVPRVRGLSAVLRIARDENSTFADALDRISSKQIGDVADEFERFTQTDSQVVTKFLNELKNTFTKEFGATVLSVGREFIESAGGIEVFSLAIKDLAVGLGFVGGLFSKTIGFVRGFGEAVGTGFLLTFDSTDFKIAQGLEDERKKSEAILKSLEAGFKKSQANINQETEKSNNLRIKLLQQNAAQVRKAFFAEVDASVEANDSLVENRKNALDKIIGLQQDFVNDLKKKAEQEEEAIGASKERSKDIRFELEQDLFERRIENLNPLSQGIALQKRANALAAEAANLLSSKTSTDEDRKRAESLFDEAKALNEQGDAIAKQTGNAALQANSRQNLVRLANQQLAAERQLQQVSEERSKKANEASKAAARDLNKLKELAIIINDATSQFDDKGNLLPEDTRAKNLQAGNKALKEFQSLIVKQDNVDPLNLLQLGNIRSKLNKELDSLEIDSILISSSAQAKLTKTVEDALNKVDVNFQEIFGLDKFELSLKVGFAVENEDDIVKATKELQTQKDTIVAQTTEYKKSRDALKQTNKEIEEGARKTLETLKAAEGERGLPKKELEGPIKSIAEGLTELKKIPTDDLDARTAQIEKIAAAMVKLQTGFQTLRDSFGGEFVLPRGLSQEQFVEVQTGLTNVGKLLDQLPAKLNKVKTTPVPDLGELNGLINLLKNVDTQLEQSDGKFRETGQTFKATIIDAGQTVTTIASDAQRIAAAAQTAANAAQVAAAARASVQGGEFAVFGRKLNYRAFGGANRGLDTVPVMGRVGERIVNPRSSANFASQIQAINAGQNPSYRNEGGPVSQTSISIGDINVQGGPTGTQTGRQIAAQLRREFRRGTSNLKG